MKKIKRIKPRTRFPFKPTKIESNKGKKSYNRQENKNKKQESQESELNVITFKPDSWYILPKEHECCYCTQCGKNERVLTHSLKLCKLHLLIHSDKILPSLTVR